MSDKDPDPDFFYAPPASSKRPRASDGPEPATVSGGGGGDRRSSRQSPKTLIFNIETDGADDNERRALLAQQQALSAGAQGSASVASARVLLGILRPPRPAPDAPQSSGQGAQRAQGAADEAPRADGASASTRDAPRRAVDAYVLPGPPALAVAPIPPLEIPVIIPVIPATTLGQSARHQRLAAVRRTREQKYGAAGASEEVRAAVPAHAHSVQSSTVQPAPEVERQTLQAWKNALEQSTLAARTRHDFLVLQTVHSESQQRIVDLQAVHLQAQQRIVDLQEEVSSTRMHTENTIGSLNSDNRGLQVRLALRKKTSERQSQEKLERLRQDCRRAARGADAHGGEISRCKQCLQQNLDMYMAEIDRPVRREDRVSAEERSRLLAAFDSSPLNHTTHLQKDLMTTCTEGHDVCSVCAGGLLARFVDPESNNVKCRIGGCRGHFRTTGPLSLAGMAHTEEERAQLARYQLYTPPDETVASNRPDLVEMWERYDKIIYSLQSGICCPVCRHGASLPENCGHITCDGCGAHFCAWCGELGRTLADGDSARLLSGDDPADATTVVHSHMQMCVHYFWALNFCTSDRNGETAFRYQHMVRPEAIDRNWHGREGRESGKPVAGVLEDRRSLVLACAHYRLSLPQDHQVHYQRTRPTFLMPVSNLDFPFSRVWGNGGVRDSDNPGYVSLCFWRNKKHVEVQMKSYINGDGEEIQCELTEVHGYHESDLRSMTMSIVHFQKFCAQLEDWVKSNVLLYRAPIGSQRLISKERLIEVFEFKDKVRHHLECQVPWQALLAMRSHQLRDSGFYQNTPRNLLPDERFKPFADTWRLSDTHLFTALTELGPYFRTVDNVVCKTLRREPWEGLPFVHPDMISISERTQAGIVYNEVLAQRPHEPNWEFGLAFHQAFKSEMDKYAESNEPGAMPEKPFLARGLNN